MNQARDRHPRPRARGFTLVEALLATAVLAFAVAALTQAVVAGQMHTYDAMHSGRAVALGEALLEEILALPYEDPAGPDAAGPEADETTRQLYDNINDYHGHTESPTWLTDAENNTYPALYQEFTRSASVVTDTVSVAAFGTVQNGVTVTVVVSEGVGGRTWTVERFVPEPSS